MGDGKMVHRGYTMVDNTLKLQQQYLVKLVHDFDHPQFVNYVPVTTS